MMEIQFGTAIDLEAAAAFLEANELSSDPLRCSAGASEALFTVAYRGGCVVGVARGGQARQAPGSGAAIAGMFHINTVFVDPAARGAGVGRRLVERLLAEAGTTGFSTAQLWVHTDNPPARSLYERLGFVPMGAPVDDESRGSIQRMCRAL